VSLFPWKKKAVFFTEAEQAALLDAIRQAEQRTSGEVRLYVESHCRFMDPVDRATELFARLRMTETKDRNATLIYLAVKDHQVAVVGDTGIHEKVGQPYWEEEVNKMLLEFRAEHLAEGLKQCILDIGEALHQHFPYDKETDKNELPDEIIFGR